MSSEFLLKTAAVLEAAAALIEENEAKTAAAVKTARESTLKTLGERYTAATGEELPADLMAKIASSDESVLAAMTQLVTKTASTVESMGDSTGPREPSSQQPVSKKEAAQNAWDRFGNFIINS